MIKTDTVLCEDNGEEIPVLLWKSPTCIRHAKNLKGALQSGTEVKVMNRRQIDGYDFYEVKARQGGRMQRGWVYKTMLIGKRED